MIYGDATGFTAYFTARAKTISSSWGVVAINAALLVASEWIDGVYGSSFIGHKTGGFTQEREWPRTGAEARATGVWGSYYNFPTDAIPTEVKNATYEAAYRQLTTPGSLSLDYTPAKYKKLSIDGAVSLEYAQFSSASETQTKLNIVDTILALLLDSNSPNQMSSLSGPMSRV